MIDTLKSFYIKSLKTMEGFVHIMLKDIGTSLIKILLFNERSFIFTETLSVKIRVTCINMSI